MYTINRDEECDGYTEQTGARFRLFAYRLESIKISANDAKQKTDLGDASHLVSEGDNRR